jgi:LysM repeat protein
MPDYKPNPLVRAVAVSALIAAFVLVVAVIVTSGGGSDDGDNGTAQVKTDSSKRGRKAVEKGVWIVRSGDTLGKISEQTNVDVDTLIQLNPDLDPQALLEGQRIALR